MFVDVILWPRIHSIRGMAMLIVRPCGRMVFLGFFMLVNENLIIP